MIALKDFRDNNLENKLDRWNLNPNNEIDYKSYAYIHLKHYIPVNFRIILYKFHNNMLLCKVREASINRRNRQQVLNTTCDLCNTDPQTVSHLFTECITVENLREQISNDNRMITRDNVLFGYKKNAGITGLLINIICSLFVIFIWKNRGNRNIAPDSLKYFLQVWITPIIKSNPKLNDLQYFLNKLE